MEVQIRDAINTDVDNQANKLLIKHHGKEVEKGEGYKILEYESPEVYSYSLAV